MVNKDTNRYRAFGLNIESDLSIPEFLASSVGGDIVIRYGKVPSRINFAVDETNEYQISKNEFLFYIKNVAHYYIKDGELIIVEPDNGADYKSIKTYLLSTAIGMILLQRGMIPIHGSTVVIGSQGIVFAGACGAGKSTICAEFRKNGYEFLADDISVITLNSQGKALVNASFPHQRLCKDTVNLVGYNIEELSLACAADEKYIVSDLNNFRKEAVELSAIVEIFPREYCNVNITKLIGTKKIERFIKNIYCSILLGKIGVSREYFNQCINIVKNIDYYILERPMGRYTADEQVKVVIESLSVMSES
jgi:hypothetical protein